MKPNREPTEDEKMGMAWWNNSTQAERSWLMRQGRELLGDIPSVAQLWELWKTRKIES